MGVLRQACASTTHAHLQDPSCSFGPYRFPLPLCQHRARLTRPIRPHHPSTCLPLGLQSDIRWSVSPPTRLSLLTHVQGVHSGLAIVPSVAGSFFSGVSYHRASHAIGKCCNGLVRSLLSRMQCVDPVMKK